MLEVSTEEYKGRSQQVSVKFDIAFTLTQKLPSLQLILLGLSAARKFTFFHINFDSFAR